MININADLRLSRKKIKPVTNILEWIQCFRMYIVAISRSQPERVPDLLGYQALIIQAHRETVVWVMIEPSDYKQRHRGVSIGAP